MDKRLSGCPTESVSSRLISEWTEKFLYPSMVHSTMKAYELVSRVDGTGTIADYSNDKKQKAATNLLREEFKNRISPSMLLCVSPKLLALSVDSVLHRSCFRCVMYRVPLVLVYLWLFFAFFAMACVRHNGFTLRERSRDVELDVWTNPILFLITMNALS